MNSRLILLMSSILWCWLGVAVAEPQTVVSPDGNLRVTFELKSNPQPYFPGERAYYRVSYLGKPVLDDSPLGLDFVDQRAMDRDADWEAAD